MKRVFYFTLCLFALASGSSHAQLTAGLSATYPFSGNADDYSGNDNDGIIYGSVSLTEDRFGFTDCAYEFTGDTGSYITIPYDPTLAYTSSGAFSISLWYKGGSADNGDFECLYCQSVPSGFYKYYLALYDVNKALFGNAWESDSTLDTAAINWHHLVGVYNDSLYTLYKDNVLLETYSGPALSPTTDHFLIGKDFQGKLDDIAVYNRALSVAEIDTLFRLPSSCSTLGLDDPALKGYSIYPNPTNGIVQIQSPDVTQETEVFVYDLMGKLMLRKSMSGASVTTLNLADLADGIYVLKLANRFGQRTELIRKNR